MSGFDFASLGTGDGVTDLHSAFADALGIPRRRRPVELRKAVDIPHVVPNRRERRATQRQLRMRRLP